MYDFTEWHQVAEISGLSMILSLNYSYVFIEGSTGSVESKVGEFKLFVFTIRFEEAKEYRKSYGTYLRLNQWEDLTVEVWI